MHIRPAPFDLPCAGRLTTANSKPSSFKALLRTQLHYDVPTPDTTLLTMLLLPLLMQHPLQPPPCCCTFAID
jgi:hypothetical protein